MSQHARDSGGVAIFIPSSDRSDVSRTPTEVFSSAARSFVPSSVCLQGCRPGAARSGLGSCWSRWKSVRPVFSEQGSGCAVSLVLRKCARRQPEVQKYPELMAAQQRHEADMKGTCQGRLALIFGRSKFLQNPVHHQISIICSSSNYLHFLTNLIKIHF